MKDIIKKIPLWEMWGGPPVDEEELSKLRQVHKGRPLRYFLDCPYCCNSKVFSISFTPENSDKLEVNCNICKRRFRTEHGKDSLIPMEDSV